MPAARQDPITRAFGRPDVTDLGLGRAEIPLQATAEGTLCCSHTEPMPPTPSCEAIL